MAKLPPEKLPQQYDAEILQRLMEDVYEQFSETNRDRIKSAMDAHSRIRDAEGRISTLEGVSDQEAIASKAMLPTPTNLRVMKVANLVVAWCDPIEIFKYPEVKGFQFFGSIDENFTPLIESAIVTFEGTHTAAAGDASWLLRGASTPGTTFSNRYKQMPFYSDMSLNTCSATITNTTLSESATLSTSCWNSMNPTVICANTTSGWNDGDSYSLNLWMPRNLIGMGMLPACVHILPAGYHLANPRWTGLHYTVKARTFGNGKYSAFASSALSDSQSAAPENLSVEEIIKLNGVPYYYLFGKPYIDIKISWDPVADADDYVVKVMEL